jgi:hypothetical protein
MLVYCISAAVMPLALCSELLFVCFDDYTVAVVRPFGSGTLNFDALLSCRQENILGTGDKKE